MAAAARRPPKVVNLDFLIHAITTAYPLSIMLQQPWISTAVKMRLVERMGRLMHAAYVGCGSPDLLLNDIVEYTTRYQDKACGSWEEFVGRAIDVEEDRNVAKFVRGLMHGQTLSAKYEDNPAFMVKEDIWLKICHACVCYLPLFTLQMLTLQRLRFGRGYRGDTSMGTICRISRIMDCISGSQWCMRYCNTNADEQGVGTPGKTIRITAHLYQITRAII